MRITYKASEKGLQDIDRARKNKGWTRQAQTWYEKAYTALPTLRRFRDGRKIQEKIFQNLCIAVGITNWEDIVDWDDFKQRYGDDNPPNDPERKLLPFPDEGCIKDPTRFFNRTEILAELYEALSFGQNRSLFGESEIGKSSILWKICQEGCNRLNLPNRYLIYLDMQLILNYEEFLTELCQKLALKLDIRSSSFGIDLRNRLKGRRYILCIDEMEVFREADAFPPENLLRILRLLRGLADGSQAPLTLVTASRSPLNELFPDDSKRSSPLANIFRQIDVDVFSETDARRFLQHRLQGNSITFTEDQINQLIAKSKCHPARLQEQAYILYRRLSQE